MVRLTSMRGDISTTPANAPKFTAHLKPEESHEDFCFLQIEALGELDWRWVAVLSAAVKGEVRAFAKGLQHVPREGPEMEDILVATPTGLQSTHSDDRLGRGQHQ